jgi:hypothetical protein
MEEKHFWEERNEGSVNKNASPPPRMSIFRVWFRGLRGVGVYIHETRSNDLVTSHRALFMFKFHNNLLPPVFNQLCTAVSKVHNYNTRHAAKESYYLQKAKTNYGLHNIRYQGPKIWNTINNKDKTSSLHIFKNAFISNLGSIHNLSSGRMPIVSWTYLVKKNLTQL